MNVSGYELLFAIVCVFLPCFRWTTALELCNKARNKCVSRVGCGMALHNYYIGCGSLIHGQTNVCTATCQKALISLLSTEDQAGEAFMTCDCDGNQFCISQKLRIDVCSKDVMPAMRSLEDYNTQISCSLAELICSADTSCFKALEYYQRHCRKLWSGEKCTARCNNSIAILYRQTKAQKLRTCLCEGTEDFDCQKIQDSTEQLCFGRHRHRHGHGSKQPHGKSYNVVTTSNGTGDCGGPENSAVSLLVQMNLFLEIVWSVLVFLINKH